MRNTGLPCVVSLRSILVRSPISRNSVQSLTRWRQWMPHLKELGVIAIAGLTVSLGVITIARLGILEGPELLAYDQMVRIRHQFGELPTDDRILVVTVTEADLKTLQEAPLTDGTVARTLQQLQAHEPAAVGLGRWIRYISCLPPRNRARGIDPSFASRQRHFHHKTARCQQPWDSCSGGSLPRPGQLQ